MSIALNFVPLAEIMTSSCDGRRAVTGTPPTSTEGKGDVAAAMVRLKKEDGGPDGVEIELWGASLPAAAGVAGDLQGAFPALAGATIEAVPLEPGSGPQMAVMVEAPAEDATPEEAKQEILEQLEANGVDGKIDVKVEDGEEGRRIEVKVEKTESGGG
ncbi:MAG TPA: hypothetical protein PKW35_22125 [Nannocystaceae bacterium]|nr:hypothetical protein [Nannocystaceae bacterium]